MLCQEKNQQLPKVTKGTEEAKQIWKNFHENLNKVEEEEAPIKNRMDT
jgi:hypothetical protein